MHREVSLGPRWTLTMIAAGLLSALALGLAILAARTVFHAAATEVSSPPAAPASRDQIGVDAGDIAPLFEIPGYEAHETMRLEAYRGHPVVLNFWASWCPPCTGEADILEDAYLHYRGQGVVFIGIDMQSDTWPESRAFLRRHGITYPVGRDERGVVGRAYRVTTLPTTFFITQDGRVREAALTGGFLGPRGGLELAQAIEQILR